MEDNNLDELLDEIKKNQDVIKALMETLEKLGDAGLVQALNNINSNAIPDNLDFFARAFTSQDFMETIFKSGNTIFSLLFMLSNSSMGDIIKGISYNSQGIADSMVESASSSQPMSLLKLLSVLKDPEVSAGMNVMLAFLKQLGLIMKKLK